MADYSTCSTPWIIQSVYTKCSGVLTIHDETSIKTAIGYIPSCSVPYVKFSDTGRCDGVHTVDSTVFNLNEGNYFSFPSGSEITGFSFAQFFSNTTEPLINKTTSEFQEVITPTTSTGESDISDYTLNGALMELVVVETFLWFGFGIFFGGVVLSLIHI